MATTLVTYIFFFKFPNQKAPFLLFGEKNHILILFVHFFEKIVKAKLRPEGSLDHFFIYFTSFRVLHFVFQGIFLHYMLLFFNFWVKIRPMFVKIWFRININWHNLVKSAMKKILLFAPLSDHVVRCSLVECLLYGCSIKLVSASLWIQRLIPSEIFF